MASANTASVGVPRVDRAGLLDLIDRGAQVVEVLPGDDYEYAHLPGAINLPLKGLDAERADVALDPGRPVVAYCADLECDMSPRATWRLGQLGYDAHDYAAGKMDWLSFGLPYDGDADLVTRHLSTDVPTCQVDEGAAEVVKRLSDGDDRCIVVNDQGVVFGVAPVDQLREASDSSAGDVTRFGVTTVRPSEEVDALSHRMEHADVEEIVVTSSDGVLLGTYRR